jgi:hypothetical protein
MVFAISTAYRMARFDACGSGRGSEEDHPGYVSPTYGEKACGTKPRCGRSGIGGSLAGGACIAGCRQLNGMPGHQRASEVAPAFFLTTYSIIRLRRLRNWSIPIVGSVKAAAQSRSDELVSTPAPSTNQVWETPKTRDLFRNDEFRALALCGVGPIQTVTLAGSTTYSISMFQNASRPSRQHFGDPSARFVAPCRRLLSVRNVVQAEGG